LKIKRVSKEDFWGIYYVKRDLGEKWDSYYSTIDALRPLFELETFARTVTGFYLNICGDFDSVRVSYFVDESDVRTVLSMFTEFFRDNGFVEVKESSPPKSYVVAGSYGGEEFEERIRNFLVLETLIGLDLIETDLLHSRCLFATYRWQVRRALLPIQDHFKRAFERCSLTWNSLSEEQRRQFFVDFEERPDPQQVDWGHLMVNLVLGADWFDELRDPHFFAPGKPMTIAQINQLVRPLGFQIPPDWRP